MDLAAAYLQEVESLRRDLGAAATARAEVDLAICRAESKGALACVQAEAQRAAAVALADAERVKAQYALAEAREARAALARAQSSPVSLTDGLAISRQVLALVQEISSVQGQGAAAPRDGGWGPAAITELVMALRKPS